MIKPIFNLVLLLTFFQICKGQAENNALYKPNLIDSITTGEQLNALISKLDNRYKDFKVNEELKFESRYSRKNYKKIADSLNVQPWTKADFDSNGLTDILVIGRISNNHSIICILDKGNKYEFKPITRRSFQENTFPIVVNNTIKYYFESEPDRVNWNKPRELQQITLTYKFGDFIEESKNTTTHTIEKLEYSTTGCLGTCSIFDLTINADRTSVWNAKRHNKIGNKEYEGIFKTKITQDKFDELLDLLNYIDFTRLKDNYAVNWTDDQGSTLKITYDNGKSKSPSMVLMRI